MQIRNATVDDIPNISTVARASWETDYPDILNRESIEDGLDEWYSPERLRESLSWTNTRILVAEIDGTITGFAHIAWERERTTEHGSDQKHGDLLRLYVHPQYRNDGIGHALFEATRSELATEGIDTMRAMVLEANELGNAFYDRLGFDQDETEEISIGDHRYVENTYVRPVETR